MAVRPWCVSCGERMIYRACQGTPLVAPCMFCGRVGDIPPLFLMSNDCRGAIRRKIYNRLSLQRPASFLKCQVMNCSLEQLHRVIEQDDEHWHLASRSRRSRVTFHNYVASDWGSTGRFCSVESPAARKGPDFSARSKGNMLAYASGSLGIVVPTMKCTHRSEEYAGVKEEWVTVTYPQGTYNYNVKWC